MSDNDNLELKKRSRRRLVGAAALALIAAIVLPMVMDDEPVIPVRDIQVTIPERTVDARPIASREPIAEPVADAPAVLPETIPAPEAEQAVRPVEPAAPAPKPEALPKPEPIPPAPPKPAPVPPPPAEPQESAEAQRARAILEGRSPPPVAPTTTQFLVQVGAFSDQAKAQGRQMELAARGFKAFIETSEGVSRVRLGPFPTRADAEAMIARLRAASFDGVVTAR